TSGFVLAQALTGFAGLNTVAAGIGQEESPVAIADQRVMVGQVTFAVWDDPVTILTTPYHAAGLREGFATRLRGHKLLGVQHFENQFHMIMLLALTDRD